MLIKGEAPWKLSHLKAKLTTIWNVKHHWRLVSLDKGFYLIQLPSEDDNNLLWSMGSLNLKPRMLQL